MDATRLTIGDEVGVTVLANLAGHAGDEVHGDDFCHCFLTEKVISYQLLVRALLTRCARLCLVVGTL